MSDITNQSLEEIIHKIKKKEISSVELTKSFIENIEKAKKLNAFVTTTFEQALDNAKKFDKKPNFDQLLPGLPLPHWLSQHGCSSENFHSAKSSGLSFASST